MSEMKHKMPHIKVIEVTDDYLLGVKGYKILKYTFAQKKWEYYAKVIDPINSFCSNFRMVRRLLRAEINKYYSFSGGNELCIARKGIFRKDPKTNHFIKTFDVKRGSRPLTLCEDVDGKIYFGEYFANWDLLPIHIYCSSDGGKNWDIVYTFEQGNINHIHGIYMDPYTKKMWIVTGDRENECIIGYTEDGFKTIKEVFRGGQDYRSCILLFYKDYIVYATDSQYQTNYIKKFDRNTHEIEVLNEIQGPVIRGAQCGDIAIIATDVEPSKDLVLERSYVWISKDGLHWEILCEGEKDRWHDAYFQFGIFDLPAYHKQKPLEEVYVTGKALKNVDNKTLVYSI